MAGSILVVDDEIDMLQLLKRSLEPDLGCRVEMASSAEMALQMLTKNRFDLVLADIKMPEMDGLELLELIKRENPGVTVVMMTATQPALDGKVGTPPNLIQGIENVIKIIEEPELLSKEFNRIDLSIPTDLNAHNDWESIKNQLVKHEQVLCIVNTRKDCRDLHGIMPEGTIHLSASMCGE